MLRNDYFHAFLRDISFHFFPKRVPVLGDLLSIFIGFLVTPLGFSLFLLLVPPPGFSSSGSLLLQVPRPPGSSSSSSEFLLRVPPLPDSSSSAFLLRDFHLFFIRIERVNAFKISCLVQSRAYLR